jgi:hypothetical protein
MNVTHNGVTEKFDRIALYATLPSAPGPVRTRQYPIRADATAPIRMDLDGIEFMLVMVTEVRDADLIDDAVRRFKGAA